LSVKIRLARTGRKNIDTYRIVVADGKYPRDGRFLEMVGTYFPQRQPKEFKIDTARVKFWMDQGAEPSETVSNLLKQDRFSQKVEALAKGVALDTLDIQRLPERKRKPKTHKSKKTQAAAA
jgi:small subunit ribosomal protein S16